MTKDLSEDEIQNEFYELGIEEIRINYNYVHNIPNTGVLNMSLLIKNIGKADFKIYLNRITDNPYRHAIACARAFRAAERAILADPECGVA